MVSQKGALYDDDSRLEEMHLLVINLRDLKLQTHPLWLLQCLTVLLGNALR
jgi:hypothetical protein